MKTRRDELIESHGEPVGTALFDIEVAAGVRAHDQYLEQQRRLAEVNAAITAKRKGAAARLAPLQAEMDRTYKLWLAACEALEAQRLADERALMGLQEQVIELTRAMNRDRFADRVKQWVKVPEGEMPQLQAG